MQFEIIASTFVKVCGEDTEILDDATDIHYYILRLVA